MLMWQLQLLNSMWAELITFHLTAILGFLRPKRGDKDGDEFDSNAFEFTGATTLTYKDVGSLEDAL